MGYDRKQLKELQNPRTEYITFDVVTMLYPYNAIIQKIPPQHIRSCLALGLSLPQDPSNLQHYIYFWQLARCQKHREELRTWAQKCAFSMRRARAS
jgi:hypothetical protein